MREIRIVLPDELYTELERVSHGVKDLAFTPEIWAQEAVESALATRRLPGLPSRVTVEDAFQRTPAPSALEDLEE